MSHGPRAYVVIRSSLVLAVSLSVYTPVRAQSAPPPQETPAPAPPMTTMPPVNNTAQGARQAGSMTEMMGAPGLVPFDIMTGQAGKWMIGYQFMWDSMDGNLVGSRETSDTTILERFFATPTDMTMQMHMGMAMYAPTDKLTLMTLFPYIRKEMNHRNVEGARFAERTGGIGDIELRGMYAVFDTLEPRQWLLLNGGVGLPTGSIDATMDGMPLEYPMQIGSGTFSLLPGVTYLGQVLPWGWAADFGSTVRVGRNDNDYRLGDRYQLGVSVTRQLKHEVSVSGGARGERWGNIRGADAMLDPTDEPTKDPHLQGGTRLSALLGITVHPQKGIFTGQHLHLQAEVPLVQSLDGPQLRKRWIVRLGWQVEF